MSSAKCREYDFYKINHPRVMKTDMPLPVVGLMIGAHANIVLLFTVRFQLIKRRCTFWKFGKPVPNCSVGFVESRYSTSKKFREGYS